MTFDKCIQLASPNCSQDIEHFCYPRKFPHAPSQSWDYPQRQTLSRSFVYCILVLSFPELHINGSLEYEVFCEKILSFSIIFLKFILCYHWEVFCILIYHSFLKIYFPVDKCLACSQFLPSMNKSMKFLVQDFSWTYDFMFLW